MSFNYEKFKKQYGEFIYEKLIDFIDTEINVKTVETIKMFIESPHLSGVYEGNQYLIMKEFHSDEVLVMDEVSESQGVSKSQTRFKLKVMDLISILKEKYEDFV